MQPLGARLRRRTSPTTHCPYPAGTVFRSLKSARTTCGGFSALEILCHCKLIVRMLAIEQRCGDCCAESAFAQIESAA